MEVEDAPDIFSDDAGPSSLHDISSVSLYCDPCKEDGQYYEAGGYCVDCTHHLCKTCFQHHHTPRPMRHHKLLDKQQMPRTKPKIVFKDECTDECSVHGDEILKYFCEDHNIFGCTICVTLAHRTCNVGYIPTLAADLFNTQDYKSLKSALKSMVRNTNSIKETAIGNLENAKRLVEKDLLKIRELRKEIDNFFDELEKEISLKLTQKMDGEKELVAKILKENTIIAEKLKEIEKEIKDKEDKAQKCCLFVNMKQLDKTIKKIKKDIDRLEKNNEKQDLTFKPSASVTSFIRNKSETLGSLVKFHEKLTLPIANIVVEDIAVLSREHLAIHCKKIRRNSNHMLIIVTKETPMKVVTQMNMPACTRGLTSVGEHEIAVLQKGNIHIYSVIDKCVLKQTLENTGLYGTVIYANGVFIGRTGSSLERLQMVNMDGDVMKTFRMEIGNETSPCDIAINTDHTAMFVSDGVKKTLTCLSFDGEVKGEYKPGSEWCPRSVTVASDGLVYVSDSKNNKIHILTSDLKPYDMIIGLRYGICGPRGLAVCCRENKLYVGFPRGKSISVFKI